MKLLCVIILFICALAATFSQWTLIGCFTLNQNYIAKEVCINKNNPALHCNGHCFLSKQLHTDDKQDNPLNTSKSKFAIQLFFYTGSSNPHNFLPAFPTHNLFFLPVISSGFLHAPFHPPSMA